MTMPAFSSMSVPSVRDLVFLEPVCEGLIAGKADEFRGFRLVTPRFVHSTLQVAASDFLEQFWQIQASSERPAKDVLPARGRYRKKCLADVFRRNGRPFAPDCSPTQRILQFSDVPGP